MQYSTVGHKRAKKSGASQGRFPFFCLRFWLQIICFCLRFWLQIIFFCLHLWKQLRGSILLNFFRGKAEISPPPFLAADNLFFCLRFWLQVFSGFFFLPPFLAVDDICFASISCMRLSRWFSSGSPATTVCRAFLSSLRGSGASAASVDMCVCRHVLTWAGVCVDMC